MSRNPTVRAPRHSLRFVAPLLGLACLACLAGSAAADEFEVEPLPSEPEIPVAEDADLGAKPLPRPRLVVMGGGLGLMDDDMDDTYGLIPTFGVGLTLPIGPQYLTFVNVHYLQKKGDPFYDNPDFTGETNRVRAVPVDFGLLVDVSTYPSFSACLGLGLQLAWIEERAPQRDPSQSATLTDYTGWGGGFLVFLTTEWRPGGGPLGVGAKIGWGGSDGEVGPGSSKHLVNLSGSAVSAFVSWEL